MSDPNDRSTDVIGFRDAATEIVPKEPDTLIDGKYRLIQRLGKGGMGEVFKVEHVHLGATRVIKVMRPQIADDKELQERFLREAQLATRIQSPNVATLHDFSTLPDGSCYMVWELIEGMDLATFVKSGGPVSVDFAIRLVIRALAGLGAVHAAGIVHRDISPQNLMVHVDEGTGDVKVKVIDLGIARSEAIDDSLTRTGMFVGKWRYASPEHMGLLEPGEKIDGRADLFSMGIVLYELLTGRAPFDADTPGQYLLLHATNRGDGRTLEGVPGPSVPGLEDVLEKALARKRDDRFGTAAEFIAALEGVLDKMDESDSVPMTILPGPGDAEVPSAVSTSTTSIAATLKVSIQPTVPDKGIRGTQRRRIAMVVMIAAASSFGVYFLTPERAGSSARTGIETPVIEASLPGAGESIEVQEATDPVVDEPVAEPVVKPAPVREQRNSAAKPVLTGPKFVAETPAEVPPPAPEVIEVAVTPDVPVSDSIPGIGRPLFGRRSKRLVDSKEYLGGFERGIIKDYGDMWSGGGCDWASVREGVRLTDYAISITPFRNLTDVQDEQLRYWLEERLQGDLDDIAGEAGRVTTENAIFNVVAGRHAVVGIEMIFRDSSGQVIAKLRHTLEESSVADAAEDLEEVIADFVEDHDVVERRN